MTAKPRRARTAQRPAPRVVSDAATDLGDVLVGELRYARLGDPGGSSVVVVPGVDGSDEVAAIPEQRVPFIGVPVCVEVSLKQANQFLPSPSVGTFVGAMTGWSIALDGVTVYGGLVPTSDPLPSLIAAAHAIPRLLALPIRPQVSADWEYRPIYLDGVPAVIHGLRGSYGVLILAIQAGLDDWREEDVDLLSDRIWWERASETSPDE